MGLNRNLSKVPEVLTVSGSYVGIGTTNPSETFHVNSGAGNVPALFESTDPIAVVQFKDNNSTGFNAVGGQTNDLLFYSNNNINMRLNSSGHGMFTNSIAVGSAAVGLSGINLPNQNYVSWYLSGGTGAQNVAIRGNGENLELSSGGGLTMTMDSSQRVGIGVSNPSALLHLSTAAGTGTSILKLSNTSGASASNIVRQEFIIGNSFGGAETVAYITALNPNATANNGGALTFSTSTNGTGTTPIERMRITSDGYLGIGTGATGVSNGDLIGVLAFKSSDASTNSSGAIGSIRSYATADYNTGNVSGDLRFYTQDTGTPNGSLLSGAERMRIGSTGNVGIGTTNPSAPLTIGRVNSAEEGGQIDLCRASDNSSAWGIDAFGSTSTPDLRFINNVASATKMTITSDGDIVMSQARSISIDLNSTPAGGSSKYWRINNNSANGTFRIQQITNGGGMYLDPSNPSGGWFGISDMRQKNDLGLIEDGALGKIMNLKARRFTFKTQEENASPSVGFFAQEIAEYLPETITKIEEEDGEVLTYNANFVIPYLVKAIQELTERIKILENK